MKILEGLKRKVCIFIGTKNIFKPPTCLHFFGFNLPFSERACYWSKIQSKDK